MARGAIDQLRHGWPRNQTRGGDPRSGLGDRGQELPDFGETVKRRHGETGNEGLAAPMPQLPVSPMLRASAWPARDWHREAFDDYAESEFTKAARRAAWAGSPTVIRQPGALSGGE